MIWKTYVNHHFLKHLTLLAAVWVGSYGGAFLVLKFLGIAEKDFRNLIINTIFLLICIGCIRLLRLSAEDVGLKLIRQRLTLHVGLSLAIFTMYWSYYLFVVRISGFRPFTATMRWGLLNYLVVAFAEEIYFRGLCYCIVEERTSSRTASLVSGLLFGLVHFRQGLGMLPKFFTGWLWGSVRYATGMIFLLIFPIHFIYNSVWLLFQGNWDNPSTLALLLPLVELFVSILIVVRLKHTRQAGLIFSETND